MEQQEFIDRLRAALNGRIPAAMVEENVNFYQDYINKEIRRGRSPEEVFGELGDPRLIAKTIIQTATQPAAQSRTADEDIAGDASAHRFGMQVPGWLIGLVCLVVVLLILGVIFSVLSFLAPVLIVMAVVLLLVKVFRDWM